MTAPLLALSLSNTVLKAGALAAFAALVGIAVLSLLVFSQARELKRLREWAGRAPERAAELEQRVSAEAAARIQRVPQPRPAGAVGGPIPRATPIVTRAAGGPATQAAAAGAGAAAATGVPPGQSPAVAKVPPATPAGAPGAVPAGQPASVPNQPVVTPPASAPAPASPIPASPIPASPNPNQPSVAPPAAPAPGQPAFVPTGQLAPRSEETPAAVVGEDNGEAKQEAPAALRGEAGVAPAAAAATAPAGRVAAGATALSGENQAASASGVATPATVAARAAVSPPRPPVPPAPAPARAATPPSTARPASPPRPGAAQTARSEPTGGAQRPAVGRAGRVAGPPFLQEERSAGRTTALIVGGVVFGVAVLVGVLLSLGGGSKGKQGTASTVSRSASSGKHGAAHHTRSSGAAAAASPAETHVVVLNATETNGLAHRLSANLQQSGYTQSTALDGHPAARSTSVVEYAGGHHTEAQQVAQTLGIAQLEPLEGAVAPLAGGATVVVIAGADQAAAGSEG